MSVVFLFVVRFCVYGTLGSYMETVWCALQMSKPVHVLVYRLLGWLVPFDRHTMRRNERHWTKRKALVGHVSIGMFIVYGLGLGPGFDLINILVTASGLAGTGAFALRALLYPLTIWAVEISIGTASGLRWWNYSYAHWVVRGCKVPVHWHGLIRFDYVFSWMAFGFAAEYVRRIIDPLLPLVRLP